MNRVISLLHKGANPYDGLELRPPDVRGWNSDSNALVSAVRDVKPLVACEVGSWKGASAINIAREMTAQRPGEPVELVCVDTWLGAREFWTWPDRDGTAKRDLMMVNGYPSVYYTFLSNVKRASLGGVITPFPCPSHTAAQVLADLGVKFDLVYIDASHEYEDVASDLRDYWELLRPGGVMLGDDYGGFWKGVTSAVDEFVMGLDWEQEQAPFSFDEESTTWRIDRR